MTVQACMLDIPPSMEREVLVRSLRPQPLLVLDTCQRLEVFGPTTISTDEFPVRDRWKNAVAFERLARIAAGLESRILGELEVLGQVRSAYKEFQANANGNHRNLDRFFQDALSLARKARRQSGIDQQMTSLGGLASREILQRVAPGQPIAVIGSGSLASGVIRYLGKRGNSPIRVSSRCPQNAMALASKVDGFSAGLAELAPLLQGVAGIVTATAAPHPVIYAEHVKDVASPVHIVDLGVPPDCCPDVAARADVYYTGLEEIESRAQGNTEERMRRAEQAAAIIRDGAQAWSQRN